VACQTVCCQNVDIGIGSFTARTDTSPPGEQPSELATKDAWIMFDASCFRNLAARIYYHKMNIGMSALLNQTPLDLSKGWNYGLAVSAGCFFTPPGRYRVSLSS
jgi:hypothetical protein